MRWIGRFARGVVGRVAGRRVRDLEAALSVAHQTIAEMSLVKHPPEPDGYFEASGMKFYRSSFNVAWLSDFQISPGCIVDVGSYDGGDAVRFKLAYPYARVIAFEADPLRSGVVRTQGAPFGIEAEKLAAFSREGQIDWYQATVNGRIGAQGSAFKHSEQLNRRFPHVLQHAAPIRVAASRLDTYCERKGIAHIDLLHVDAQGAEYDVVKGLGRLRPSLVYLEVDDGAAGWIGAKGRAEIHALMVELGYVMAADCRSDRLYVPRRLVAG